MPQNEFTIGTMGNSFKESKFFIISTIIFFLIFTFLYNPNSKLDINYRFYFLAIFLIFLVFSIVYGILKQKDIKTKLIIDKNNIFIRTYKNKMLLDEKILNKNSTFDIKTINHATTRGLKIGNTATHIFISDEINQLEYTINQSDIPLINQALLSIQNQGIKNLDQIVKKDNLIRNENNFYYKVTIISFLSIVFISTISIILALKYINKQ